MCVSLSDMMRQKKGSLIIIFSKDCLDLELCAVGGGWVGVLLFVVFLGGKFCVCCAVSSKTRF